MRYKADLDRVTKRRLLRGVVTAALVATIGAVDAVQPTRAEATPCEYVVVCPSAGPTYALAFSAITFLRNTAGEVAAEQLLEEAINSVRGARDEVISNLDHRLAERARLEADALSREFLSYDVIRQSWAVYTFASTLNQAAAADYADARTVTDLRAADQIGHALNVVYPMALVAGKDAGWTQQTLDDLNREYIEANEFLVQKLAPTCWHSDVPLAPPSMTAVERTHTCRAADGNTASGTEFVFNGAVQGTAVSVPQLKLDAAINSSWVIALEILPIIRNP